MFIPYRAETSRTIAQTVSYQSGVSRSFSGKEESQTYAHTRPRQNIDYLARISELEAAKEAENLRTRFLDTVTIPLWFEEYVINSTVVGGTRVIEGDFRHNMAPGTKVAMINPDESVWEENTVASITANNVTFNNLWTKIFPRRSSLVPVLSGKRLNFNDSLERYAVNQVDYIISITSTDFAPLVTNSTFPTMLGFPLVDLRIAMLSSLINERYFNYPSVLDHGYTFNTFSEADYANRLKGLKFTAKTRDEKTMLKTLLSHTRGRANQFYFPTFTHDLRIDYQGTSGSTIRIFNDPDIASKFPMNQLFMIVYKGQRVYRQSTGIRNNQNGTADINLSMRLPPDFPSSDVRLSYVDLIRANSDDVTITHRNGKTTMEMPSSTVLQDLATPTTPGTGTGTGDFSKDFSSSWSGGFGL